MRPIERGNAPQTFITYQDSKPSLLARIGCYCSYCEQQIFNSPAIEHKQPKSSNPELINEWNNFLLACTVCNSIKNNKNINIDDYLWVDTDNTARAFIYYKDLAPQIDPKLSSTEQKIAKNTITLTGLDRIPGHHQKTKTDNRWQHRNDAWSKAERAKNNLSQHPTESMRELIIDMATSTGFWSVWMSVFHDDSDMRLRLISAFAGTSLSCFNENTQPISRQGGKI